MTNKKSKNQSWQSRCDEIGQISELNINARLREYGRISLPFGEAPYDVLLETKTGGFIKLQTKHGKVNYGENGAISVTFRTVDTNGNSYNENDVHAFTVYSSELKQAWIVPFKWCNKTRQTICVKMNNRSQGLPACDFTFQEQLKSFV